MRDFSIGGGDGGERQRDREGSCEGERGVGERERVRHVGVKGREGEFL